MAALFENVYQMTKINLQRQDMETQERGCFRDFDPECDEQQMFT